MKTKLRLQPYQARLLAASSLSVRGGPRSVLIPSECITPARDVVSRVGNLSAPVVTVTVDEFAFWPAGIAPASR